MKKKTTLHSFSLLTFITLTEKAIAFVFEAMIAAVLGTTLITDGYFTAAELFTLIDTAFISALTVVGINRYAYYIAHDGEEKGIAVLSDIQSFYLPFMIMLSIAIFFLAKPLTRVVAPGYGVEARAVVERCIRVMSMIPSVACIISIGLSVLRQKKEFEITALKSLFISVVGIASVMAFGRSNPQNADLLSIAFVVSMALYGTLVLERARKYGRITIHKPYLTEEVKIALKMMFPLMVSYGVERVALMIDKIIASMLTVGSVSGLTYAHSLYNVVAAIFVTNLSTILLTDFNNLCAQNRHNEVSQKLSRTVRLMTIILLPITIVTLFNANAIVKIVYERGKFSLDSTVLVGNVLVVYAINFIPILIQGVNNQALYALGDTVKPMRIALVSIIANFVISLPLIYVIGLSGVAVGTVISTIISVLLGNIALHKYLPEYHGGYSKIFVGKLLFAGIICSLCILGITTRVNIALISFILSTFIAFTVFIIVLLVLKEEYTVMYAEKVLNIIKSRILHKS